MIQERLNHSDLRFQVACIILGIVGLLAYAASKFTPGKLVVMITGLGIFGFIAGLIVLAFRLKRFGLIVSAAGISLVSVIAGTYILLFTFVYFFQDEVANKTSSFFQPTTISVEAAQALVDSNVSAIDLTAPDGIHLRGWIVRSGTEARTPLAIYFGGSGSESSELIPLAKQLSGWSVALINYRGFGLSEGTPTQSNVLADALFIYDTLATRADMDASHVVAIGYSLGTGVAVSLSAERPVAGTVLVSPYDYWTLIGVKQSPLFTPLTGIMKHYFDSISCAPEIQTPVLILVGSNDTSILPDLSHGLADAWRGEVKFIEYPGEDHGLLFHTNNSLKDIGNFLQSIDLK
jgi:pimeloyl-ACP methyl ester carboxylesterase